MQVIADRARGVARPQSGLEFFPNAGPWRTVPFRDHESKVLRIPNVDGRGLRARHRLGRQRR